jgi:hypothetical protein
VKSRSIAIAFGAQSSEIVCDLRLVGNYEQEAT